MCKPFIANLKIIILLLLFSIELPFYLFGQNVVECAEFYTTISGSGIIEGGTTYCTKVVLISKQDNIQLVDIIPMNCHVYKKLRLEYNDTLTITYTTFHPHISYPQVISDSDSLCPEYQKTNKTISIFFSAHPSEYSFALCGTNTIHINYMYEGNLYSVSLPEEKLNEIMRQ